MAVIGCPEVVLASVAVFQTMIEENVGSMAMFKTRLSNTISLSTKDFLKSTRSQEYQYEYQSGDRRAWLVARVSFKTGKTPH